jgi:hypothetical protein
MGSVWLPKPSAEIFRNCEAAQVRKAATLPRADDVFRARFTGEAEQGVGRGWESDSVRRVCVVHCVELTAAMQLLLLCTPAECRVASLMSLSCWVACRKIHPALLYCPLFIRPSLTLRLSHHPLFLLGLR